jgi:hypothetical protein
VHQVSYYSVAEGDRRSIVGKIHSAQVFGVFGVPNYEVVAGHLLPRAQRPAGFIAQPDWRGLCRIAQWYKSSPAGQGRLWRPLLRDRERAPVLHDQSFTSLAHRMALISSCAS